MQTIFNYLSVGDLWALAIIAAVTALLAANCGYQKHRWLARERGAVGGAKAAAKAANAREGFVAHA